MIAVGLMASIGLLRSAGSFEPYRVEHKSVKISRKIVATMTLNRRLKTAHVTVPDVAVVDRTPSHQLSGEKLAGM